MRDLVATSMRKRDPEVLRSMFETFDDDWHYCNRYLSIYPLFSSVHSILPYVHCAVLAFLQPQLSEAYQILSDLSLRAKYDAQGASGVEDTQVCC